VCISWGKEVNNLVAKPKVSFPKVIHNGGKAVKRLAKRRGMN
tara:strand:- start:70 stop:195 length:126 start_codon:yes stop_codon:yes gene_type:complete